MSAPPVLELRGVTKFYGEREVLGGIDLAVDEGEAVAVIGASGSGKSTLLRCIDLLEEIDDGDIYLDGEPITDPGTRLLCRFWPPRPERRHFRRPRRLLLFQQNLPVATCIRPSRRHLHRAARARRS